MSKIKVTELGLDGVKTIEPMVFSDNRGSNFESYSIKDMQDIGINFNFCLDYQAYNKEKNTLRGIHFQNYPKTQAKLVRVLSGAIMDYVIDLRKDSPTYKKWVCCELSADNHKQIVIPVGFGHAFVTLAESTCVLYKFDDYYDGPSCRTIRWDDPEIGIKWERADYIMSDKDKNAPYLRDCDICFMED